MQDSVEEKSQPKQNEIHHIQTLRQENGLIKQAQDIFFVSIFDIFGSYEETVDMM